MRSTFCNARHGPCTCFRFSDLQLLLQTLSGEAKFAVMLNPLPIQKLNFQNVGQKLQALKQLLLNHPLRVLVTLVISRGLWIPLLESLALYGSVGLAIALRILFYPIEFAVSKLPKKCKKVVGAYLAETLQILLRPLALGIDLTAFIVPWTADFEGHPLLNLAFSPRSALLFVLLNLRYYHQRGRDFAHGVAHFVVLGFRRRCTNFLQMMSTCGRFWNRQYLDFLLKVGSLSVSDPLELASMVTMTSPAGESLWNLGARVGHTLVPLILWWIQHFCRGTLDHLLRRFAEQDFELKASFGSCA